MEMRTTSVVRGLVVVLAMMCATAAVAQANDSTVTEQKGTAPATPQTPAKNAVQKFPYPGEEPAATAAPVNAPGQVKAPPGYENETPYVPDAPKAAAAAPGGKTPPPYPGDPDAVAPSLPGGAKTPPPYPGDPEASSSSSSAGESSSSSSSSSDSGPLTDEGSTGDEPLPDARRDQDRKRKKLPKIDPVTPESREAEDLNVAEFYQKSGNFAGAYARAKDAVETIPNDPFAHFALAEAARKLGKQDEAKAQYALVLTLDPAPKEQKAAQKALAEFSTARR